MTTTLPAPPEKVWPWLAQMGGERAGFYSWDRLDHGGEPSADRIVPEWQSLQVGQRLNAEPSGQNRMTVELIEPKHTLVLRENFELPSGHSFDPQCGPKSSAYRDGIWGFYLQPAPGRQTRLVAHTATAPVGSRSWDRSTCCLANPCTSSCRPASSMACAPGRRSCDLAGQVDDARRRSPR